MGLGGFVLGGALQGIGAGLIGMGQQQAATAASAAAERRDIALENLRNELATKRDVKQGEIQRQTATHASGLRRQEMALDYGFKDVNDARANNRTTKSQVTLKSIDASNAQNLARLNASLARQNDAASTQLRAAIENGQIKDTFEGLDGNIYAVFFDGRTKNTGVKYAPKTADAGTGAISSAVAARGGAAAPGAGIQQAAPPQQPAASPAPSQVQTKVYTQADAVFTAKQHGIPVSEVHKRMRASGYKLAAQ